ncbi:hypothetical protein [Flavobacterium cerinum]|uniref:Uncharacterized protein n=1 Tax=Flavobacterium cerinum TaxID=2502784 RepID=A0A444HD69_9FLAO|nr:hypothetical protein [Flavobacterium cerinum]RWX02219.1 hypothetical protein EPI11_03105 [Flavobacterium cerinum]
MSYTKLNNEIERYYKQNNMSFGYNALTTTKEEQEERLKTYNQTRDIIVKKWIDEGKYKELISSAHGRWFPYDEFTKPLAEFFIKEGLISQLKFLCEKEIRLKIEDTLKCVKNVEENFPTVTKEEMTTYNLEVYLEGKSYHPIGELSKWRAKSLKLLDNYIELLKNTSETAYLETIEDIRKKVSMMTIKKNDLKFIKHKI